MSERAMELARELVIELDAEHRARVPRCVVCGEGLWLAGPRHWVQRADTTRRFWFCQRHWEDLVEPAGIDWYHGNPVFRVVYMRGQPPP